MRRAAVGSGLASAVVLTAVVGTGPVTVAQTYATISGTQSVATLSLSRTAGVVIQVEGTWAGTLTFQSTATGSAWADLPVTRLHDGSQTTSTTTNGIFALDNLGYAAVRVRASSWSSGTATVAFGAVRVDVVVSNPQLVSISGLTSAVYQPRTDPSGVFQVTGTWSGTLVFEVTVNDTDWVPLPTLRQSDGALVTTTTSNDLFAVSNRGYTRLRVRATSWTSGVATVAYAGGYGSTPLTTAGGGGGSGDIDGVVAGDGLTGGGTSGTVTLAVGEGLAIDVTADQVHFDPTELTGSRTWGDGSTDTIVWTFDRASGVDPTITILNGAFGLPALTLTTPLAVSSGGTGAASLTGLVQGQGTSAVTAITNSSVTGQVLRVTGSATYAWGAVDLANANAVTGDLPYSALPACGGSTLVGNLATGAGDVGCVTLSAVMTAAGMLPFTDPDADRLIYWNDAAGQAQGATLSSVFTLSGGTLGLTVPVRFFYNTAVCQDGTASLGLSTLSGLAPTATCITGTNMTRGWATFPDSDGDYALMGEVPLPSDWTGAIDISGVWRTAATSGAIVLQAATSCTASGQTLSDTWNTSATVTETAESTANRLNAWTITNVSTSGCAAGDLMTFRVFRSRTHGSDTLTGTFDLGPITITLRRTL